MKYVLHIKAVEIMQTGIASVCVVMCYLRVPDIVSHSRNVMLTINVTKI
jgi:hypothetical protein